MPDFNKTLEFPKPPLNTSCPLDVIPSNVPPPAADVSYALVPSWTPNDNKKALRTCCENSTVHVIKDCWQWCQLPPQTRNAKAKDIAGDFEKCLSEHKIGNQLTGTFIHIAGSPALQSQTGWTFALLMGMVAAAQLL